MGRGSWPFCDVLLRGQIPPPTGYPAEPETIGEHLRKHRIDLGLTQKAVAADLCINPETLRNWEIGHTEMAMRFYPAVVRFLGYDPMPDPQTLGERVRSKRMRLGLTQAELARELGVDESNVWRVEHEERLWKRKLGRVFSEFGK